MNKIEKKNKRGQAMGGLVLLFIGIIVAAALIPQIANNQEAMRTTYTYSGKNVAPAVAGSAVYLTGQNLLSTPTVVNLTGNQNCANNVSFTDVAVSPTTGVQTIKMTSDAQYVATEDCPFVNITYTYGPSGYIADSGGRTIAGLIVLFSALALVAFAIFIWYKNNGGLFGF